MYCILPKTVQFKRCKKKISDRRCIWSSAIMIAKQKHTLRNIDGVKFSRILKEMAEMAHRIDAISKHLGQTLKYANECEHVHIRQNSHAYTLLFNQFQVVLLLLLSPSPCKTAAVHAFAHSFPYISLLILFFCHKGKKKGKDSEKRERKN